MPTLLSELRSCPINHFLSSDHRFDLVVFDEASQVPPWEAINCTYRVAQLIVARRLQAADLVLAGGPSMIRQGRGSSMDSMVRILDERAEDFAEALTEVGFSTAEAHRFLKGAAPALLRSCEWQYAALGQESLDEPASAREILSLIPGRSLASQLGLPVEKTWAGLRELVPAVLQASQSGRPGARTGGVRPSVRRSTNPSTTHYDFGFGLTLEREPRDGASKGFSADNLLFGGRLSRQD